MAWLAQSRTASIMTVVLDASAAAGPPLNREGQKVPSVSPGPVLMTYARTLNRCAASGTSRPRSVLITGDLFVHARS